MITDIAADSEKKKEGGRSEEKKEKEQEEKNSRGISYVLQQGYFFSLLFAFILDEDQPDWHDEWHYPHLAILLDAPSVCLLSCLSKSIYHRR